MRRRGQWDSWETMMSDNDPPQDYIGVGFRVDPSSGSPVDETVKLEIEPDGFDVEARAEPDETLVTIELRDSSRSAGADLLMTGFRASELMDRVSVALQEVDRS